MPEGYFLESWPTGIFVIAHILFILVGYWSFKSSKKHNQPYAGLIWIYIITQFFFLAMFGGFITMKLAVLMEQICIVIIIVLLGMFKRN
jgi:hypothetical protein